MIIGNNLKVKFETLHQSPTINMSSRYHSNDATIYSLLKVRCVGSNPQKTAQIFSHECKVGQTFNNR